MTSITSNYTEARFSKDDSALLLIDHQSGIMQLNHDPTPVEFRSAAIALAKVGKIFNLPTIITSSYETGPNGPIIQELLDLHPNAPIIRRPGQISAWDNEEFVAAVGEGHRPQKSDHGRRHMRSLPRLSCDAGRGRRLQRLRRN